ncbi:MAG: DUF4743 domain-containing protein [Ostreibacterium sp.]
MPLIDRIHDLNNCFLGREYFRLYANEMSVGFVDTQMLDDLRHTSGRDIFHINADQQRIDLRFSDRSVFEVEIEVFFKAFFARKGLSGWRNEYYAVTEHYARKTLFLLERAALSFLGMTGYGVHVNGYVKKKDGLSMWVAKRSATKPTSPGKLDQIAAGGQPYHLSVWENMIKECEEEASIPQYLAEKAIPVSVISYRYDLPIGMRPDVIFNYDLQLPMDFAPSVNDDEVESFQLYPIATLLDMIAHSQIFKFNSAVVIIDFAIRHGFITSGHPDYLDLQEGMHQEGQRHI